MSASRKFVFYQFGIAAAIAALFSVAAYGQEADDKAADENEEIEEIIVTARKPGDRKRVDREYEDPVRAKLLKDFYKMKEDQEEFEWRMSAVEESSPRISWGYDPRDEYRMRNEMALQDLPSERTKPATLFKVDF